MQNKYIQKLNIFIQLWLKKNQLKISQLTD